MRYSTVLMNYLMIREIPLSIPKVIDVMPQMLLTLLMLQRLVWLDNNRKFVSVYIIFTIHIVMYNINYFLLQYESPLT